MANSRARRIAAVAAGTVVLAGGAGVAVAASGGNPPASSFFDSVAKHLGVSPQKLQDATKAAAIDQVNQALADGHITKDQADAMKKRIESGDVPPLGGFGGRAFGPGPGGPGGPGFGFGFGGGPGMIKPFVEDGLAAAAKYLGLTESALRTQLSNGTSLADVAKAQNKDVSGLQDAIVASVQSDLDKAVTDKKLTQDQANAALSALKSHIGDLVNGKLNFHIGARFGHRGLVVGAGDQLAAAAKYLGLSESALQTQLRSGKSLADVAKAQNKDVKGLEDTLVAAQQTQLDKAVTAKKLTQSQADAILSQLKSHVDDLVNAKPGSAPRFRQAPPSGPRFFF